MCIYVAALRAETYKFIHRCINLCLINAATYIIYIYIYTHTHCNHEKPQQLKKQPPFTIFKCEVHMIQTCLQLTHSPYWMEMCHIAPQSTATQRAPVTHSYILHPFCRLHVIRPPPHKLTSLKSPRLSWDFCTGVEARGVRGEVSPCPLSSCIL